MNPPTKDSLNGTSKTSSLDILRGVSYPRSCDDSRSSLCGDTRVRGLRDGYIRISLLSSIVDFIMTVYCTGDGYVPNGRLKKRRTISLTMAIHYKYDYDLKCTMWHNVSRSVLSMKIL